MCVSASALVRKLWTCAGKSLKLVSVPLKPCMYTINRVRLPSLADRVGASDAIDDEGDDPSPDNPDRVLWDLPLLL